MRTLRRARAASGVFSLGVRDGRAETRKDPGLGRPSLERWIRWIRWTRRAYAATRIWLEPGELGGRRATHATAGQRIARNWRRHRLWPLPCRLGCRESMQREIHAMHAVVPSGSARVGRCWLAGTSLSLLPDHTSNAAACAGRRAGGSVATPVRRAAHRAAPRTVTYPVCARGCTGLVLVPETPAECVPCAKLRLRHVEGGRTGCIQAKLAHASCRLQALPLAGGRACAVARRSCVGVRLRLLSAAARSTCACCRRTQ